MKNTKRVNELCEQITEALDKLYEMYDENEEAISCGLENILDHELMHS